MAMIDVLNPESIKLIGTYATPNPVHKHAKWELALFEKGSCLNVINGVSYETAIGDVFLLGPMHLHAIKVLTPHIHKDLYFENDAVEKVLSCFGENFKRDVLSGKTLVRLRLNVQDFNSVLKNVNALDGLIITETMKNQNVDLRPIVSIESAILQYVIGIFLSESYIRSTGYPDWFYSFLYKLNNPEYFTKSVDELIADANYSHTQFGKLFKKYLGVTLVDYLKTLRLVYAAKLLAHTDKTTLFICEDCGYNSYSYFERTFKEKYGLTPNQYRKKFLAKQNDEQRG